MQEKKWEYEGDKKKYLVLIIYDIVDNKRRTKFAKYLQQYALRVQYSAFETSLSQKQLDELLSGIPSLIEEEDNIRVYKTPAQGYIYFWGNTESHWEDVIIV